eukprot:m51a1_g14725 putative serine threonine protein (908) ;mRNA; f:200567-207640
MSPALSSDPVLHWTFDGPDAASRLLDSSGRGLAAALGGYEYSSNITWERGIVGTHAIRLLPVWPQTLGEHTRGVACPYLVSPVLQDVGIRGMAPFTLSLWMRPDLPVSSVAGLASWVATIGVMSNGVWALGTVRLSVRPGEELVAGAKGVAEVYTHRSFREVAGEWMHVALSYDGTLGGSRMSLYTNGRLVDAIVPQVKFVYPSQLYIGFEFAPQLCYGGLLDDVRLYNRPLSSGEVYGLWAGLCPLPGARTGPCRDFECSAGTVDEDSLAFTPCVKCRAGTYAARGSYGRCPDCHSHQTDDDYSPATPMIIREQQSGVFVESRVQRDNWFHVAMTYDGASLLMFINGAMCSLAADQAQCNRSVLGCDWCGRRRRRLRYYDEVAASEILLGEVVGQGSFGVVHKAVWRDTEVAAKVFRADSLRPQDIRQAEKEVDVMRALRHPNILLFMCHAKSETKFIIVTELMPTGSLMELLANESTPLPLRLKLSILCDIARGMAYLHQSNPPILHRDLKSSNILAKVSDFGLTIFSRARDGSCEERARAIGTTFWTAPEVLQGASYTSKCDVYAFGIVSWEVVTREVPYEEENPHTVALRVVHDILRPPVHNRNIPAPIAELAAECWDASPGKRPSFSAINSRLSSMSSILEEEIMRDEAIGVNAPRGSIALVFTDIEGSTSLWEWNAAVMKASLRLHNEIIRKCFREHRGYEVKTEGDAFMLAFQSPLDALHFCQEAQAELLGAKWDPELLAHERCSEVFSGAALSFRGFRVRMGIHYGHADMEAAQGSAVDYIGPTVNKAARVASLAQGGQVLVSSAARMEIERLQGPLEAVRPAGPASMRVVGRFQLRGIAEEEVISEVVLQGLGRAFEPAAQQQQQRGHARGRHSGRSVQEASAALTQSQTSHEQASCL